MTLAFQSSETRVCRARMNTCAGTDLEGCDKTGVLVWHHTHFRRPSVSTTACKVTLSDTFVRMNGCCPWDTQLSAVISPGDLSFCFKAQDQAPWYDQPDATRRAKYMIKSGAQDSHWKLAMSKGAVIFTSLGLGWLCRPQHDGRFACEHNLSPLWNQDKKSWEQTVFGCRLETSNCAIANRKLCGSSWALLRGTLNIPRPEKTIVQIQYSNSIQCFLRKPLGLRVVSFSGKEIQIMRNWSFD